MDESIFKLAHKHFLRQYMVFRFSESHLPLKKQLKYGNGDKIILPQNDLHSFSSLAQKVYTLQLCNPKCYKDKIVAGVLDFDAPDKIAFVPDWIMDALCLNSGDKMNADPIVLKPITEVTFKFPPDIIDPKAVLEYLLSKHAVLYENKKIKVNMFEKEYIFQVVHIVPKYGTICNADITLNLVS